MKGSPNEKAARQAADKLIPRLRSGEINPGDIQIVAHSNGVPTAHYFLNYIAGKHSPINIGNTLLIAPNTSNEAVIDQIFASSSRELLIQSKNDEQLNRRFSANLSIGDILSKRWPFLITFQKGHPIREYRKAICGQ
ncbi:MAG: hypothetical protein ACRD5H_08445 [Nitrososphaerales archaeon]